MKKFSNNQYHIVAAPTNDPSYRLLIEIDQAFQGFRAAKEILMTTPLLNGQGETIRPIECDHVHTISNEIKDNIRYISQKIRSLDKLQLSSYSSSSSLVMYLYSATDKSYKLMELMKQLRRVCTESTNQKQNVFQKAKMDISVFANTCEQIEMETNEFLENMFLKYLSNRTSDILN